MMGPSTVGLSRTKEVVLNFHYRIRIQVKIRTLWFLGFLFYRNLYDFCKRGIEKSRCEDPFDLVIRIGFPLSRRVRSFHRSEEVHFTKDYLYCRYRRKIIKGEVEIFNIEGARIFVNLKVDLFGRLFFPMDLFDSLIHFAAFQKGMCLVHGASIGKEGKGVLLLGAVGSGKTPLVISSSERGFGLIDDDLTFVHQGKILGYNGPFIYLKSYHQKTVPSLSWRTKAELFVKEGISLLTNGYINPVTPVPIGLFFKERRIESATLKKVYYLNQEVDPEGKRVEGGKGVIDSIILELKTYFPFLAKLCEVYSDVNPNSIGSTHWERLRKRLEEELNEISYMEIRTHLAVRKGKLEEVFTEIENAIRATSRLGS
jgi:hypothetical protein